MTTTEENPPPIGSVIALLVVIVFICMLCFWAGIHTGREVMEREAVREGHADYYADEYGGSEWRWVPMESGDSDDD